MPPNRYFDNAATSFPKPAAVGAAVLRYLNEVGGPYGRSSYPRALEVSRTVEALRDRLAARFGLARPESLVFMPNATTAINTVLHSLLRRGGRVLVSPVEHNAVMRPLAALAARSGVTFGLLPAQPDGKVDVARLAAALTPDVRLAVVNHQSNVNGLIQPLPQIREALGTVPLLIDASQSAGSVPILIDAWRLDYLAFTGHKGLLGPTGTGGLVLRDPATVEPLVQGGTGSASASYEMPGFAPDCFEAGTGNLAGLFGLLAAVEQRPVPQHSRQDFLDLVEGLRGLPGVNVLAAHEPDDQGELVSVRHDRHSSSWLGDELQRRFGIEVRVGLHCAPLAHRTLGSFPGGTVRIAPSPYHSPADFADLLTCLRELAVT